MQIPLENLYPEISTDRMHDAGDLDKKAYRAHISFDGSDDNWVAWATYGPAVAPDRARTMIFRSKNLHSALAAAQDRVNAKYRKGYEVPGTTREGVFAQSDLKALETRFGA